MDENAAEKAWESLCNEQGWGEESQIIHLEGFLRDRGLMAEFVRYAQQAAEEENAEADAVSDEGMAPS